MNLRKWLLPVLGVLLGCAVLLGAYNVILDPFGVFGDHFLAWYAYDMTRNPRVAKIAYLDRHNEAYDSYVIGGSNASALPVDQLNDYMDASFYNMTGYRGDLAAEKKLVEYILEHYHVENIVLTVDPQSAACYDDGADSVEDAMHCKVAQSSRLRFYGN